MARSVAPKASVPGSGTLTVICPPKEEPEVASLQAALVVGLELEEPDI